MQRQMLKNPCRRQINGFPRAVATHSRSVQDGPRKKRLSLSSKKISNRRIRQGRGEDRELTRGQRAAWQETQEYDVEEEAASAAPAARAATAPPGAWPP